MVKGDMSRVMLTKQQAEWGAKERNKKKARRKVCLFQMYKVDAIKEADIIAENSGLASYYPDFRHYTLKEKMEVLMDEGFLDEDGCIIMDE